MELSFAFVRSANRMRCTIVLVGFFLRLWEIFSWKKFPSARLPAPRILGFLSAVNIRVPVFRRQPPEKNVGCSELPSAIRSYLSLAVAVFQQPGGRPVRQSLYVRIFISRLPAGFGKNHRIPPGFVRKTVFLCIDTEYALWYNFHVNLMSPATDGFVEHHMERGACFCFPADRLGTFIHVGKCALYIF